MLSGICEVSSQELRGFKVSRWGIRDVIVSVYFTRSGSEKIMAHVHGRKGNVFQFLSSEIDCNHPR